MKIILCRDSSQIGIAVIDCYNSKKKRKRNKKKEKRKKKKKEIKGVKIEEKIRKEKYDKFQIQ